MFCAHCGEETADRPCTACGEEPLLDGRWRLEEVIGRGAMGVTWRGADDDGHAVAVKEIALGAAVDAKTVELARREAEVLRQLDHPSIPTFIDEVDQGQGKARALYLVQELIEGTDLAEEALSRRTTEDEVLDILDELCEVLGYLHGLSPPVIHRDLKPANVRRRADGSLVLVDFGSVRDAINDPQLGGDTVAGTFGYMAPEQFAGEASEQSDLYALGAMAVALLTREDPAKLQGHDRKIRWRHLANETGPVGDAIDRLLAMRPADRPSDAAEARELLREAREQRDAPSRLPAILTIGTTTVLALFGGANLVLLTAMMAAAFYIQPYLPVWLVGGESPPTEHPAPSPSPSPSPAPVAPAPSPAPVAPAPAPEPPPRPRIKPHGRPGMVHVVWPGKRGAKLTIDGRHVGSLPVTTRLKAGTHTFTLKEGPVEMSTTIDVALHGKRTKLDLSDHW